MTEEYTHTLYNIDNKDYAVNQPNRGSYLIDKIDMAWGINDIEKVRFP